MALRAPLSWQRLLPLAAPIRCPPSPAGNRAKAPENSKRPGRTAAAPGPWHCHWHGTRLPRPGSVPALPERPEGCRVSRPSRTQAGLRGPAGQRLLPPLGEPRGEGPRAARRPQQRVPARSPESRWAGLRRPGRGLRGWIRGRGRGVGASARPLRPPRRAAPPPGHCPSCRGRQSPARPRPAAPGHGRARVGMYRTEGRCPGQATGLSSAHPSPQAPGKAWGIRLGSGLSSHSLPYFGEMEARIRVPTRPP